MGLLCNGANRVRRFPLGATHNRLYHPRRGDSRIARPIVSQSPHLGAIPLLFLVGANCVRPSPIAPQSPHPSSTFAKCGGFCAIARNSHNPIDKPPILCYSIIEKESDRTWKSPRSEWRKRSEGCSESAGRFVHFYPERKIS